MLMPSVQLIGSSCVWPGQGSGVGVGVRVGVRLGLVHMVRTRPAMSMKRPMFSITKMKTVKAKRST